MNSTILSRLLAMFRHWPPYAPETMGSKKTQAGSALLTTLIILLLLSIIGVNAIDTTTTELQITRNYRVYKENLYRAEGAVMELAQLFENALEEAGTSSIGSVNDNATVVDALAESPTTWSSNATAASIVDAGHVWAPRGVPSGSSLDISKSRVHRYYLYGRGSSQDGQVIVKIGYRKAF